MIGKANPIINEPSWKRKHRTMVVVQLDESFSGDYKERVERFLESINRRDTIKADVFILFDGVLEHIDSNLIKPKGKKSGGRSQKSLHKFATESGYTQVCLLFESL